MKTNKWEVDGLIVCQTLKNKTEILRLHDEYSEIHIEAPAIILFEATTDDK